jgi:hypothetical protein
MSEALGPIPSTTKTNKKFEKNKIMIKEKKRERERVPWNLEGNHLIVMSQQAGKKKNFFQEIHVLYCVE